MYKQKITILLLLALCTSLSLVAQKENRAKNRQGDAMEFGSCSICKVSMMSGKFENDLDVKNDDTIEIYEGEDFVVGSATTNPVAYVSGDRIALRVILELNCPNSNNLNIQIRGTSDRFLFESEVFSSSNMALAQSPTMQADNLLPNQKIDLFDLLIDWEVSLDGGVSWNDVGRSLNRVYVVWKELLQGVATNEGLYHFSCTYAEGFHSSAVDIVEAIWQPFTTRNISTSEFDRPTNNILTYYETHPTECTDYTLYLLSPPDGQCGAFNDLFQELLLLQGINADNMTLECIRSGEEFLVKNWQFVSTTFPEEFYPYLNQIRMVFTQTGTNMDDVIVTTCHPDIRLQNNQYEWLGMPDVIDLEGVNGQGNTNPYSDFSSHQVSAFQGIIYDPSYGKKYSSLRDWEETSIEAIYQLQKIPNPSGGENYYLYIRKNSDNEVDIQN